MSTLDDNFATFIEELKQFSPTSLDILQKMIMTPDEVLQTFADFLKLELWNLSKFFEFLRTPEQKLDRHINEIINQQEYTFEGMEESCQEEFKPEFESQQKNTILSQLKPEIVNNNIELVQNIDKTSFFPQLIDKQPQNLQNCQLYEQVQQILPKDILDDDYKIFSELLYAKFQQNQAQFPYKSIKLEVQQIGKYIVDNLTELINYKYYNSIVINASNLWGSLYRQWGVYINGISDINLMINVKNKDGTRISDEFYIDFYKLLRKNQISEWRVENQNGVKGKISIFDIKGSFKQYIYSGYTFISFNDEFSYISNKLIFSYLQIDKDDNIFRSLLFALKKWHFYNFKINDYQTELFSFHALTILLISFFQESGYFPYLQQLGKNQNQLNSYIKEFEIYEEGFVNRVKIDTYIADVGNEKIQQLIYAQYGYPNIQNLGLKLQEFFAWTLKRCSLSYKYMINIKNDDKIFNQQKRIAFSILNPFCPFRIYERFQFEDIENQDFKYNVGGREDQLTGVDKDKILQKFRSAEKKLKYGNFEDFSRFL